MRHFLSCELGPEAVAVARLSRRLQSSSTRFHPVRRRGAPQRLASLLRTAFTTQPLAPVTRVAETQLDSTTVAEGEPVLAGQEAPCRRFLDMELEP